jgi:hypothetical protein
MHSLTSVVDGGEWSALHLGRFTPRERTPGAHWIGGWVGPRTILDAVEKKKIPSPRQECAGSFTARSVSLRHTPNWKTTPHRLSVTVYLVYSRLPFNA